MTVVVMVIQGGYFVPLIKETDVGGGTLMQPDTWLPHNTLGDLQVLPSRGDRPLPVTPEVLSLSCHSKLHH